MERTEWIRSPGAALGGGAGAGPGRAGRRLLRPGRLLHIRGPAACAGASGDRHRVDLPRRIRGADAAGSSPPRSRPGAPEPGVANAHIRRVEPAREYPLTHAQRRIWFLEQLHPDRPTYRMITGLRLRGALRTEALEQALGQLVARHAALRTTFHERDGVPVQSVQPAGPVPFTVIDLRSSGRAAGGRCAARRPGGGAPAAQPADRPPPARHPAPSRRGRPVPVASGPSPGVRCPVALVVLRELGEFYRAAVQGTAPPLPVSRLTTSTTPCGSSRHRPRNGGSTIAPTGWNSSVRSPRCWNSPRTTPVRRYPTSRGRGSPCPCPPGCPSGLGGPPHGRKPPWRRYCWPRSRRYSTATRRASRWWWACSWPGEAATSPRASSGSS